MRWSALRADQPVFDPGRDGWQLMAFIMNVTLPRGSRLEKRTEA
ncbi:hypothetical protein [Streptomyces chattanoogensis]|nr:hypothetical protein T261_6881 [Streptomyces lydicus]